MLKIILFFGFTFWGLSAITAQQPYIHSHNDYEQNVAFWQAVSAGCQSVEADIYLVGDKLYVSHDFKDIDTTRTLERLYLQPFTAFFSENYVRQKPPLMFFLIDIKSEAEPTLKRLAEVMQYYPGLTQNQGLKIVISGNRPAAATYDQYPEFIYFDFQQITDWPTATADKIAMVSMSFRKFSAWDGKEPLSRVDKEKLSAAIRFAHDHQRPVRFWATPDTPLAWATMRDLGVDFINTDHPAEAVWYFQQRER